MFEKLSDEQMRVLAYLLNYGIHLSDEELESDAMNIDDIFEKEMGERNLWPKKENK